jgi:hypothetical protein
MNSEHFLVKGRDNRGGEREKKRTLLVLIISIAFFPSLFFSLEMNEFLLEEDSDVQCKKKINKYPKVLYRIIEASE